MDHDRTALVQLAIALIIWGSISLGYASNAEENAISWQPGKFVDGGGRPESFYTIFSSFPPFPAPMGLCLCINGNGLGRSYSTARVQANATCTPRCSAPGWMSSTVW